MDEKKCSECERLEVLNLALLRRQRTAQEVARRLAEQVAALRETALKIDLMVALQDRE